MYSVHLVLLVTVPQHVAAITLEEALAGPTDRGVITLPLGSRSYAIKVESFEVGNPAAAQIYSIATDVLGPPNYNKQTDTGAANLGCRGEITVRFSPGVLRSISGPDLYLFDIGSHKEMVQVEISKDNKRWIEIDQVDGTPEGTPVDFQDLVPYGDTFEFVRLTDLGDRCKGTYPGVDIDAVAAVGVPLELDTTPGGILISSPMWARELHSWWLTEIDTGATEVVVVGDTSAVVRAGTYRLTWVQHEEGVSQVTLPREIMIRPGRMTVVKLSTGITVSGMLDSQLPEYWGLRDSLSGELMGSFRRRSKLLVPPGDYDLVANFATIRLKSSKLNKISGKLRNAATGQPTKPGETELSDTCSPVPTNCPPCVDRNASCQASETDVGGSLAQKDTAQPSTSIPKNIDSWCANSACICYEGDHDSIKFMGPHVTASLQYGKSGNPDTITLIDCESAERPDNCIWIYYNLSERVRYAGRLIGDRVGHYVIKGEIALSELNDQKEPGLPRLLMEASEVQCQVMTGNFHQ